MKKDIIIQTWSRPLLEFPWARGCDTASFPTNCNISDLSMQNWWRNHTYLDKIWLEQLSMSKHIYGVFFIKRTVYCNCTWIRITVGRLGYHQDMRWNLASPRTFSFVTILATFLVMPSSNSFDKTPLCPPFACRKLCFPFLQSSTSPSVWAQKRYT